MITSDRFPAFRLPRPLARRRARDAFTLVEIMIVVVIIGLLVAMAVPTLGRIKSQAVAKRYLNDVRQIAAGAERYAMEAGQFPPNGIGALHPALRGYVPDTLFGTTTPLGGVWDWDYQQNGFAVSISVYQFTAPDAQLLLIDREIDDGNLNAGSFRKDSSKVIYILQF
jgi:prepilin-type N-terminal cleavage/methylation domain-containing protein